MVKWRASWAQLTGARPRIRKRAARKRGHLALVGEDTVGPSARRKERVLERSGLGSPAPAVSSAFWKRMRRGAVQRLGSRRCSFGIRALYRLPSPATGGGPQSGFGKTARRANVWGREGCAKGRAHRLQKHTAAARPVRFLQAHPPIPALVTLTDEEGPMPRSVRSVC